VAALVASKPASRAPSSCGESRLPLESAQLHGSDSWHCGGIRLARRAHRNGLACQAQGEPAQLRRRGCTASRAACISVHGHSCIAFIIVCSIVRAWSMVRAVLAVAPRLLPGCQRLVGGLTGDLGRRRTSESWRARDRPARASDDTGEAAAASAGARTIMGKSSSRTDAILAAAPRGLPGGQRLVGGLTGDVGRRRPGDAAAASADADASPAPALLIVEPEIGSLVLSTDGWMPWSLSVVSGSMSRGWVEERGLELLSFSTPRFL
jgi:hypothetical protein